MKRLLLLFLAAAAFASAQQASFPGLRSVMTAAEWSRAGLDQLSPDQIGVIDAALIRHVILSSEKLKDEIKAARAEAVAARTEVVATKRTIWERFGLSKDSVNWRDLPPLTGKVTAWQGGNRFTLDNGQVWEGQEQIPYELAGRDVRIEARPGGNFALGLDGESATVRVRRVK